MPKTALEVLTFLLDHGATLTNPSPNQYKLAANEAEVSFAADPNTGAHDFFNVTLAPAVAALYDQLYPAVEEAPETD